MTRFGRYRLLEQLGTGGMAVVTRAVVDGPKGFEREIVVKRILADLSHHPSFARMLATEARLSARLRHPGIVQVHEFGEVDGEYYLAMELVDGVDLSALIKACRRQQVKIPIGVVGYIISQVASALAYAHTLCDDEGQPLGIVHRDISPSNVMVTPVGAVKLLDFGIAKVTDRLREDQTRTSIGSLKGKLCYLSPEQAEGAELDGRSDIFSLGIVFYELLTLKKLFRGANEIETMRMVRDGVIKPPSTVVEGIPPAVDDVVMRMLAKKPQLRFGDSDELAAALAGITRRLDGDAVALRRFLRELGPIARGQGANAAAAAGHAPAAGTPQPGTPQPSTPPRSGSSLRHAYGEARPVSRTSLLARAASDSRAVWATATMVAIVGAVLLGGVAFPARPQPALPTSTPPAARPAATATAPAPTVTSALAPAATAPGTTPPAETAPAATAPAATTAPAAPAAMAPATPPPTATVPAGVAPVATAPAAPAASRPLPQPTAAPATTAFAARPALPAGAPIASAQSTTLARADDRVRLSLTGTEDAEVLVDGRLLGTVPLQTTLPRRATSRNITVRRPGFVRWTREVDGQSDSALVVVLERIRASTHILRDPFQ